MSILRTYNVQNPDSASVNVELSANGGVRVAGLSTFSGELQVGTGVTISGGIITATGGINVGTGASISSPSSNVLTLGTSNVERVRINSSGNLGIGLTNPQAKLNLSVSSSSGGVVSGTTPEGIAINFPTTDGCYGGLWFSSQFGDDQGISGITGSRTNNYQTDLRFYTNNTNAARSFTERVRITGIGSVGIGVTNPDSLLHLKSTTGNVRHTIETPDTFQAFTNYSAASSEFSIGYIRNSGVDHSFRFCAADGLSSNEIMRIDSVNQRVGIGTTNPSSLLHLSSTTAPQLNVQAPTPGGADSQLRISSSAGNYRRIIFYDSAATPTKNNFEIAVQEVDNSLFFGPSTAVGGLTFSGSTGLIIDSSGRVTTPSQPYAIVHFNSGDTGAYNNKIGPTLAKTIPTGIISNSFSLYNSSNGRFTAPVTGLYEFGFSSNVYVNTASGYINIATYKNGSVYTYHYEDKIASSWQYIAFSDRIALNANDYVELWMSTNTGTLGCDSGPPWSPINFRLIG